MKLSLVDRYETPAEPIFSAAIDYPVFPPDKLRKFIDRTVSHGEYHSAVISWTVDSLKWRSTERDEHTRYSTTDRGGWLWRNDPGYYVDAGYYIGSVEPLEPTHSAEIVTEIAALIERCGGRDWDGAGARPVHLDTIRVAQKFADRLPRIDPPDVSATPHGEIDFDWCVARDQMLTVSVGPPPDHEIAFAGLFGETRIRGREPWAGKVPHFVQCCFEMVARVTTGKSDH